MLKITDVEYLGEYKLELSFDNGESGIVDLKSVLDTGLYKSLRDKNVFIQFGLINGTIEWVNGADLAPEFLYNLSLNQIGLNSA